MRRIEKEIREIKNLIRHGDIEEFKKYLQVMRTPQKKELLLEISQKDLDMLRAYEDRPDWELAGFGGAAQDDDRFYTYIENYDRGLTARFKRIPYIGICDEMAQLIHEEKLTLGIKQALVPAELDTWKNPDSTKLTELYYALKSGDFEKSVALIENTPLYPDTQMVGGKTESGHALTYAVQSGNLALVKYLCEQYEADSFTDEKISTMVKALALNAASERGHEDVANYLLSRGARPNYVLSDKDWDIYGDNYYSKILVSAIRSGKLNLVRMLVDNGARIHDPALELALCNGEENITRFLFERNIWVDLKSRDFSHRYMQYAAISGNEQKLMMLVNDYKLDLFKMIFSKDRFDLILFKPKPESLFGSWDNKVQKHPVTDEPIFTFRITKNGEEIGLAQYYKHPLFCRSESGDRHNVLKTSGILSQLKIDTNTTNEICAALPPTFFEELMQSALPSVKHGAIRGLAKVVGHVTAVSKKSKMTVEMTQYSAYLFGYFLLCCYDNKQSQNNDSYLNAMLNTVFMAAMNIFMLSVCYVLKSLGHYAAQHGWNKTGNLFRLGHECAQYGIFAMDAKQRGMVAAVSSVAAGYTAQSVVESVGNRVIDRVLRH